MQGYTLERSEKEIVVTIVTMEGVSPTVAKGNQKLYLEMSEGTKGFDVVSASALLVAQLLKGAKNEREEDIIWDSVKERAEELIEMNGGNEDAN